MPFPPNSSFLVTGGTGSFGRRFVAALLRDHQPQRVVVFSRDEQKHVGMMRGGFSPVDHPALQYVVGDVRDPRSLDRAMAGVDYVIHAAAMKHVDIAEQNPQECIATNIGGAENVIDACRRASVQQVVALSTDKAANPVSVYGATKLCADKLFTAQQLGAASGPQFAVVRYGNVFGSQGSVAPFFIKQRAAGLLTITDDRMTRFIITLDQCVAFVLLAFSRMQGGEIFVPKIPSTRIVDLATAIAPGCPTKIIGVRPGEKLHECMIPADDAYRTQEFADCFVIQPSGRLQPPETTDRQSGAACPVGFSYTSDANPHWLTQDELQTMIRALEPTGSMPLERAA